MADGLLHMPRRAVNRFRDLDSADRLFPALAAVVLLSGGMIAGALFFQHVMGVIPCKLCLIQRQPHYMALGLGAAGLLLGTLSLGPRLLGDLRAWLLGVAGIALLVTGGYGVYHTGAERGWWLDPADCTGSAVPENIGALNALLAKGEEFVRCDEVPWSFLGLSLAGYNALVSLAGAVFVLFILVGYFRARTRTPHGAEQHG